MHKALETFSIPKALNTASRRSLSPIFRDTAELTAHHSLPQKIREAAESSRYLIVLCSPAAKASHWVNEEIKLFRARHGDRAILCALLEGNPQTSFPPALLEDGREPLAANLSGGKDNFRLGITQLAASMLGVGLDQLIQRETKRRRRRLQAVTAFAIAFSGFMGATTYSAVNARNAAEVNRSQAEGLVEYMITDLKEKLDEVGRLDLLGSVGDEVLAYYDRRSIDTVSDENLARQARAIFILAQVAFDEDRIDDAHTLIMRAAEWTKGILERHPYDSDAIFAHSQSEYWLGALARNNKDFKAAFGPWTRYNELSIKLVEIDPLNEAWIKEAGYSENNLANLSYKLENPSEALRRFESALEYYRRYQKQSPNDLSIYRPIANSLSGAARCAFKLGDADKAFSLRQEQISIYDNVISEDPGNYNIIFKRAQAKAMLIEFGMIKAQSEIYDIYKAEALSGFKIVTKHEPNNSYWNNSYSTFKDITAKIEAGDTIKSASK